MTRVYDTLIIDRQQSPSHTLTIMGHSFASPLTIQTSLGNGLTWGAGTCNGKTFARSMVTLAHRVVALGNTIIKIIRL